MRYQAPAVVRPASRAYKYTFKYITYYMPLNDTVTIQ